MKIQYLEKELWVVLDKRHSQPPSNISSLTHAHMGHVVVKSSVNGARVLVRKWCALSGAKQTWIFADCLGFLNWCECNDGPPEVVTWPGPAWLISLPRFRVISSTLEWAHGIKYICLGWGEHWHVAISLSLPCEYKHNEGKIKPNTPDGIVTHIGTTCFKPNPVRC